MSFGYLLDTLGSCVLMLCPASQKVLHLPLKLPFLPELIAFFWLCSWEHRHDTSLQPAHFFRHRSSTGAKKQYLSSPGPIPRASPQQARGSRPREVAEHHRGIDKSNKVTAALGKVWLLCCAVLCCAVLCCAVLCCAVLCCAVLCCAVLCCAVLCWKQKALSSKLCSNSD